MFYALFFVAFIVGVFTFFAPPKQSQGPLSWITNSGETIETVFHKKNQEVNVTTSDGILQVRQKMDDLAVEQNKILDTIKDQQVVLKNTSQGVNNILLEAQNSGEASGRDILQLKALATDIQDQQKLMVAHGKDLIALNDQLTQNRQWIADQIDYSNLYTETALRMLRKRNQFLKTQADEFFESQYAYREALRDRMLRMHEQLYNFIHNQGYYLWAKQQMIRDHIQRVLDKEHENMERLDEIERRDKELEERTKEKLEETKDLFDDLLQNNRDLMEQEQQKIVDLEEKNKQQVADQRQRLEDEQDRQRMKNF